MRTKLLLLLICGVLAGLWVLDRCYPMPEQPSFSSVVLAQNGEVLRAFSNKKQQWRYPIANDQVPQHYLDVLLGYEDRWFYWHFGVNPFAVMRAGWQNLVAGKVVSGGSTLTMQVARLLSPHPRTLVGKVQQVLRAIQLEWHLSKDEILNLYLNLAPFGGTVIGVQAASISYFDKPLKTLSDAEAALLAVLPQAPSRLRPDRHPQRAQRARDKVLKRMQQLTLWPVQRVQDALAEPIFALKQQSPMLAPLLARRLKKQCPDCEKITTLIDIDMQRQLEELIADYTEQLPEKLSVGVMVMENDSGAVRSYIGSANFLDDKRSGHVDLVQAVRSPGSTLKPFLYGLAIDQGLIHSQSLLQDTPRFNKAYRPKNFSGGFNGPVSVTQALQRSLNIPAVQVLEQLEPEFFAAKLQSAGLKLQGEGAVKPNIAMILGGVGTRLEHLVGTYSALARSGLSIKPRLKEQTEKVERFLLSEGAAWITWKMLTFDPLHKVYGSNLDNRWQLAWKTGTSYGYREAWAMGVSRQWSIGVWVGRPDGSASPGLSGRKTAAPLLFKVARAIGADKGLEQPQNVKADVICWPLGGHISTPLNTSNNCHKQLTAWTLDSTAPKTLADQSLIKKVWRNKLNQRVTPRCDNGQLSSSEIALWPIALEPWLPKRQRRRGLLEDMPQECQALFPLDTAQAAISITSVAHDSFYQFDPQGLDLQLLAQGGKGRRSWYLNGKYLANRAADQLYDLHLKRRGRFQLSVVDESGNSDVIKFTVR